MLGEAVVVFDPALVPGMLHLRKQTLQLASKMRFIAAQFDALLTDELWLPERHARQRDGAAALRRRRRASTASRYPRPPRPTPCSRCCRAAARERLQQEFDFYEWDDATGEVRWMCSWDTTEDDIDEFARAVRAAVAAI